MKSATQPLNKGEMVLGIIEIFDIAESAVQENNELKRQLADREHYTDNRVNEPSAYGHFEAIMLKRGREIVLKESLYTWQEATATKDKKTGEVKVTPFDEWLNNKVMKIPDYMSREEFMAYFSVELEAIYESEKEKAITRLTVKEDESE